MARIPNHWGMNGDGITQQNLVKTSDFMQLIQTRQKKNIQNNEIVEKSASCLIKTRILINLIKTRILKFARQQIQNNSAKKIDDTLEKLESLPLTLNNRRKMENQFKPDNPMRITIIRNPQPGNGSHL